MRQDITVLQVEDEAIVAMQMAYELKRDGFQVLPHVATGEAAIASARKNGPDVILMDICLAGSLDGIETALAIRRESAVPIIFVTGYDDHGHRERAAALRPLGFLIKPRAGAEIRDLIQGYFGRGPTLNEA